MKQVVQAYRNGQIHVIEVPRPIVQGAGVLVANCCSLISSGTERATVENGRRSLLRKLRSRPDQVLRLGKLALRQGLGVFHRVIQDKLSDFSPLGYASAGRVVEIGEGAVDLRLGDRVSCAGAGYANHAEFAYVPRNLCVKLPDNVAFEDGVFTTVGAIALQAVRQTEVALRDRVLVIGLGLVGQLVVQLLKVAGCFVAGVDLESRRVELAASLGLDLGVDLVDVDCARRTLLEGTECGFDAVIITAATSSNEPIQLAVELCRDRGRIVVVGVIGLTVPFQPSYRKEVDIRFSRSYGPGRYDPLYEEHGIDYPYGYVRWTENRNMEAFLELVTQRKLNLSPLITHRFPVSEAALAYAKLNGERDKKVSKPLAILLEYAPNLAVESTTSIAVDGPAAHQVCRSTEMCIGLIGAGQHMRGVLLPALQQVPQLRIKAVVSGSGLSARRLAQMHGIPWCASDYRDLLADEEIDAVVVATRHDSHARLVRDSVEAGKSVFVEKPLAISLDELRMVLDLREKAGVPVTVGFNRRFAPFVKQIKSWFAGIRPLQILYRVNAGFLARDHWLHDPTTGGGRVAGEMCHFVDLCSTLADSSIEQVWATAVSTPELVLPEDVNATLVFANGSVATVMYSGRGTSALPKERFEVFAGKRIAMCDDFQELILGNGDRVKRERVRTQDKGHCDLAKAFVQSVAANSPPPIPFLEAFQSTLATLCVLESCRCGKPVQLVGILDRLKQVGDNAVRA